MWLVRVGFVAFDLGIGLGGLLLSLAITRKEATIEIPIDFSASPI